MTSIKTPDSFDGEREQSGQEELPLEQPGLLELQDKLSEHRKEHRRRQEEIEKFFGAPMATLLTREELTMWDLVGRLPNDMAARMSGEDNEEDIKGLSTTGMKRFAAEEDDGFHSDGDLGQKQSFEWHGSGVDVEDFASVGWVSEESAGDSDGCIGE